MHTERDHWQVARQALELGGPLDEQTMASLEVLAERLGRLKRIYPCLADVGFSPQTEALLSRISHVHAQ